LTYHEKDQVKRDIYGLERYPSNRKRTYNLATRFEEDWVVCPETEEAPYNFIITEWEVQEVEPNPRHYDYCHEKLPRGIIPTYAQIVKGTVVSLPKRRTLPIAEQKFVHPQEQKHVLEHPYFCQIFGCEYHPSY